jgi:hypothetical protein
MQTIRRLMAILMLKTKRLAKVDAHHVVSVQNAASVQNALSDLSVVSAQNVVPFVALTVLPKLQVQQAQQLLVWCPQLPWTKWVLIAKLLI